MKTPFQQGIRKNINCKKISWEHFVKDKKIDIDSRSNRLAKAFCIVEEDEL
jgi:hypothetical protein